jgi:uncharacterized protein (TIGR02996 family)
MTSASEDATLSSLFDAVYAAPDDDAPRLVLADALMERDPTRGEFIILQIRMARGEATPAQIAREAEIRRTHPILAWAQPLSNAGAVEFARGFPSEIRIAAELPETIVGHPAWATITAIDGLMLAANSRAREILAQPALRSLRALKEVSSELVAMLPAPWPLTRLEMVGAERLAAGALAPGQRLESLVLRSSAGIAPALLADLTALRSLALTYGKAIDPFASARQLDDAQARLALPAGLEKLAIDTRGGPVFHGLAGAPRLRDLSLKIGSLVGLAEALADLPALESLSLVCFLGLAQPPPFFTRPTPLRRLSLSMHCVSAAMLAPLRDLVELHLDASTVEEGALAPFGRLEQLTIHCVNALDRVPEAPLRSLGIRTGPPPLSAAQLEQLLNRFPALEELVLALPNDRIVDQSLVRVLEASRLAQVRFTVAHDGVVTLTRDADGALSRLAFSGYAFDVATSLGAMLPRRKETGPF